MWALIAASGAQRVGIDLYQAADSSQNSITNIISHFVGLDSSLDLAAHQQASTYASSHLSVRSLEFP